jgi:hypothetical protein
MRHIASILAVLCLVLSAPSFAAGQNQRVFVSTSFSPASIPSQPGQEVILASLPVGVSMRHLLTFDVFAEGLVNVALGDSTVGHIDIWICDKSDCRGNLKKNLVNVPQAYLLSGIGDFGSTVPTPLHLSGTFAHTNPGHRTDAVLTGQLSYVLMSPNPSETWCTGQNFCWSDVATAQTQPIDLDTGGRYLVLTFTAKGGGTSPSDIVTMTVFRVNMVP